MRSVDNAEAVNLVFCLRQVAWQLAPAVHSARATCRMPDEVGGHEVLGDPVQLTVTELVTNAVRGRWWSHRNDRLVGIPAGSEMIVDCPKRHGRWSRHRPAVASPPSGHGRRRDDPAF